MNTFVRRLLGAAALDASVYEEVEADEGATTQALVVVLLSSAAAGIGAQDLSDNSPASVAFFGTVSLVAWIGWAFVTYELGVRILPEPQTQADLGQLLRTIGFATAPGLLRILALVPGARAWVFAVTAVWMLVAMIVAVRQALDFKSTGRAIGVCAMGWVLSLLFAFVLGLLFGPSVASAQTQRTGGTPPSLINPSLYGRDTFELYCAPCHGLKGQGDGPVAAALKTPPADLTKLAAKNNGVFPRQQVEEFVTNGRPVAAHGSSAMPVWGPTFRSLEPSDRLVRERIANVVQYVESLQVK